MTKKERIKQVYKEANQYVDEDTFKKFEGEMIRGSYFTTNKLDEEGIFFQAMIIGKEIAESILTSMKSGRNYDFIAVLKDDGKFDDSEAAHIERQRRVYRYRKQEEEIKAKVKAIEDEPEDD